MVILGFTETIFLDLLFLSAFFYVVCKALLSSQFIQIDNNNNQCTKG